MNLTSKIPLLATVLFPTSTNAKYDYYIGNWKRGGGNPLVSLFQSSLNIDEQNVEAAAIKLIDDLNNVLLSFYINDYLPKKIYYFQSDGLGSGQTSLLLSGILGTGKVFPEESIEQIAAKSFSRFTFFTPKEFNNINYEIPKKEILEWYTFFNNNPFVARSLMLIQEGYGYLHALFHEGHTRYFDQYLFRSAILLVIAGLENLLLQNEKTEIAFKFSTIGAVFYEKYVSDEYFASFNSSITKLSFTDFLEVLKILYDIRSKIAHGTHNFLSNRIDNMLQKLNVHSPTDSNSAFRQHSLIALNLLQVHILGIIKCAGENLKKGGDIIKEIYPYKTKDAIK